MKIFTFLALLTLGCVVTSCETDSDDLCAIKADINSGIIVESVEFTCWQGLSVGDEHLITTATDFQAASPDCNDPAPTIDFDQFSVLGLTTGASGCERYYDRSVSKDDNAQEYRYRVTIIECGGCEPWAIQTHWVKVPRIPVGYTVRFEIVQ